MKEILQSIFKAGKGLTKLTKEDLEKIFNELKKRGELKEEDKDFFISKTLEKIEKTGQTVTEKIKKAINPNLEKINNINAKIDALIKEIKALKKKK